MPITTHEYYKAIIRDLQCSFLEASISLIDMDTVHAPSDFDIILFISDMNNNILHIIPTTYVDIRTITK